MTFPPLQFGLSHGLPLLMQSEAAECGLACVAMVAGYHGLDIDLLSLRQRFSLGARGATLKHLVDVGAVLKLASRPVKVELDDLAHLRLPCILHWDMTHFVVLRKVVTAPDGTLRAVHLHDPARGRVKVNAAEVSASFTGVALEMTPAQDFARRVERQRIRIGELVTSAAGLRPALLQILGLALALEVFALLSPLFIQLVVDGPIASADYDMLTVIVIGFGGLMLFQTMIGAFRSWMVIYCSTHLNMQWVANVFTHLLNLPLAFFEKRQLGDVISRFNSINVIQETLSTKFIEAILDGMLALTALAVLLHYSMSLAGVVLVFLSSYGLLRWATFIANRRASEEQLSSKAIEQSLFMESVRGIQAIKLFNQESARHVRWLNALAENINRKIAAQRLSLLFTTSSTMLTGAENIAVVWLGARLVIDHTFSIGMLFAFLAYKGVFSARAYALVDKLQELRMLSLHGERLGDIVLTPREDSDVALDQSSLAGVGAEHMTIELKNVSFRYSDADPWVIRNLSLVIHPGQSLALVGQSGCGKTTLLKLLIGILIPTEGEILIGGTPLKRFGARRYRELIGTVMQDDQLFAGTVAENISFFDQRQDFARVHACAGAASVAMDLQAMPMGYASLIGDMGASLSGGQKQRLLLARALYKQPQILFLDEATSHLDMDNELAVNESIRQLNLTRVIVAHRRETIATAQRVVELSQGAIVRDFLQTQREDAACA